MATTNDVKLKKQLGLFDVYVISTGAMFSSGFFLLPGLAASQTGSSVVLAYLLSGLLVLPAMLSQAELATAMPRAGGTYYFLDRTLGPLVGAIGGMGTWLALVLKSGFALIGMGAYLALLFEVPIKPVAIGATVLFATLNIAGVRESSGVLRVLVITVLSVIGFFVLQGLVEVGFQTVQDPSRARYAPFLREGVDGLLDTVGLVFVSYVGLTKVASMAEEVRQPDRAIPLGMGLSLATTTGLYVLGVFIMVAALGTEPLSGSLTPAADAAAVFFGWLPDGIGRLMIVVAAVAACASMSNAGIMAASRYPLAMARDRLVPDRFATIGRLRTPVLAVLVTCAMLVVFLLVLDVIQVAKLAGALQLFIFTLINVAVVVMRESEIEAYDPGFRSPLYPWTQVVGIVVPLVLIGEMGWLSVLFTAGVMAVAVGWYVYYARERVVREGAIYHVFERLGRQRFAGLDRELRDIMKEKGLRAEDPFDEVVTRAAVLDLPAATGLGEVVAQASRVLENRVPMSSERLEDGFGRGLRMGGTPVAHGAALLHARFGECGVPELVVVRCREGVIVEGADPDTARQAAEVPVRAVFFLVSGQQDPGRHLRILAQLAARVEAEDFMDEWLAGADEQELKEALLRDERFLSLLVARRTPTESLVGRALRELEMPEGSLVALIRRQGEVLVPRGRTVLQEGDRLTIIGEPMGLATLAERYGKGRMKGSLAGKAK